MLFLFLLFKMHLLCCSLCQNRGGPACHICGSMIANACPKNSPKFAKQKIVAIFIIPRLGHGIFCNVLFFGISFVDIFSDDGLCNYASCSLLFWLLLVYSIKKHCHILFMLVSYWFRTNIEIFMLLSHHAAFLYKNIAVMCIPTLLRSYIERSISISIWFWSDYD